MGDSVKKKMTRLTVAGAMAVALCIPVAGAAAAADPGPEQQPTLQVEPATAILATSADTDADTAALKTDEAAYELEGLDEVQYPWYAATQSDGVARFTWGPGLPAEDPASVDAQIASADATIMAGTCTLLVDTADKVGGTLRSATLVTCVGDPAGGIQTQANFRRSSWSGYRDYSSVGTSSLTASQTQDVPWVVTCGLGTAGTYDYVLRARGVTGTYGASAWFSSTTANRYACGTGIS